MTDDRFARRLPELMHDLAGTDERYLDDILARTAQTRQRSRLTFATRWLPMRPAFGWRPVLGIRMVMVLLLVAMLALLVGTAAFIGSRRDDPPSGHVGNGWVAFSTQPGFWEVGATDDREGGDIYLVREGVEPRLIVARGEEMKTNVCPAFSPDGSKLAYGQRAGSRRALVVLTMHEDGSVAESTRLDVPDGGTAPCARWSTDGTRLAYAENSRPRSESASGPVLVVRGLDGSTLARADGDPSIDEFARNQDGELPVSPAPAGDRAATVTDDGWVLLPADGADGHVGSDLQGYSIAAWSPDGRWVLTMHDTGGGFTLVARAMDPPFQSVVLAADVRTNGQRSWPRRGDVSWQPVYP